MDQKTTGEPPFSGVDTSEASHSARPWPAARRAEALGFPEIFQQHARFLWRTLMNLGVPSSDAQDLCQEVMIIVHRRLPEFEGQSLRGWLYGICVRVASDYRRSARARREILNGELPESGSAPDQPDQLDQRAERQRLMRALERVGEEKRAALILYEVEELTLAEVSEALGVPLQTVYSRIKAARQELRRELLQEPHGELGGAREAG
jgi:RNA polymerase sigma-70 factor (ECF subfamily)